MFSNVRPFFRTRLDGLGFNEHRDSVLTPENVGNTLLGRVYHLGGPTITKLPRSFTTDQFIYAIPVTMFTKRHKVEAEAIDEADLIIDTVLSDLLAAERRTQEVIKNIELDSVQREPLDVNNDNAIRIIFNFNVTLIECF